MGWFRNIGSMWLLRRFPAVGIAHFAYGLFKRHRSKPPRR